MTRNEVKQLLMTLETMYSNFHVATETMSFTIDTWHRFLEPYSVADINMALQIYVNNSGSAFAPSVSEIISLINKPVELANTDPSTAWMLVRKAISRSAYNSKEEFAKLPEMVQKAIGGAEMLRLWAVDENYNNEVVMSLFMKNYKAICERDITERMLPDEARNRLEQIRREHVRYIDNNVLMLGQKPDKLQEGDFDYNKPEPESETLGYYAQKLRDKLKEE